MDFIVERVEKYWIENCPYIFYVAKPVRQKLNLETKTANYTIGTYLEKCKKFNEIDKIIQTGFKKAYKKEWNLDYLKDWPEVSVYSDKKYDRQYLVDGIALASEKIVMKKYYLYGGINYEKVDCFLSEDLNKGKFNFLTPYFYTEYLPKKIASLAEIKEYEYYPNKTWVNDFVNSKYIADYCSNSESRYKVSLYDIKFVITDKSGNKLFESPRCNTNYVCEWNDVPQDIIKLIEADEIDSTVTEVYLEYGKIEDFAVKGNRTYLKNLPELKIENFSYEDVFEKKQKIEEELEKQRKAFMNMQSFVRDYMSPLFERKVKKTKKTPAYFVANCKYIICGNDDSDTFSYAFGYVGKYFRGYQEIVDKYGLEKINKVLNYLKCNMFSYDDGLQPYYTCSAEDNYYTEVECFLENFDEISENPLSNEWHLPSDEEVKYIDSLRSKQLRAVFNIDNGQYDLANINTSRDGFIIRTEK